MKNEKEMTDSWLKQKYLNKQPLKYTDEMGMVTYIGYTHEKYNEAYEQLKKSNNRGDKSYSNDLLSSDYIIIQKDGYVYIIGDLSAEFLIENISSLNSNIDIKNSKGIKLYNNLALGENKLNGLNINVTKNEDSSLTLNEEIDCEFHRNNEIISDKYKGLDVIDENYLHDENNSYKNNSKENVNTFKNNDIPSTSKKVKFRKKASLSLVQKFKNLKTWQKALIVAGIIALVGTGTYFLVPKLADTINNLLQNNNLPSNSNSVELPQTYIVNDKMTQLNYDNVSAGHQVFTNAYDATNGSNGVIANEWFNNNPVDVFNTTSNSYMNLSSSQLNDPNFMAELAKNSDNAVLLGNSFNDPSGFVNLNDVVSNIKVK